MVQYNWAKPSDVSIADIIAISGLAIAVVLTFLFLWN